MKEQSPSGVPSETVAASLARPTSEDVGSSFNPRAPEASPADQTPADDDDDSLPAPGKVWEGPRESLAVLMAKQVASIKAEAPNVEPVSGGYFSSKWQAMIALVAQKTPSLPGLLQNGQLVGIEDGFAVIRYSPAHETHVKLLERNGKKDIVRDALSQVMEQPVGIRFEIGTVSTAPAKASAMTTTTPLPVPSSPGPGAPTLPRPETNPKPAPVKPPPPPIVADNSVRLTEEIRSNLYKSDPLIRAVVDQLGGSIIKLEE